MVDTGLIHIYCGDGKGKTTAAMGLALRCCGGGGKVLIFQFLKDNTSSERNILRQIPGITLIQGYEKMKFSFAMSDTEKKNLKKFCQKAFLEIAKLAGRGGFQLLILDEVLAAITLGFIEEMQVVEFLKNKPKDLEVVLTGRNPGEKLIETADYISGIQKIKHPYDNGIRARKGIEY